MYLEHSSAIHHVDSRASEHTFFLFFLYVCLFVCLFVCFCLFLFFLSSLLPDSMLDIEIVYIITFSCFHQML